MRRTLSASTNDCTMGSDKIVVGMGGWQLEPFNGVFYPSHPPKGFRKLRFYSRFFDMVEVNATFYSTDLGARNARRWLDDVSGNERFIFSVKLFKGFTHTMDARHRDVKNVRSLLDFLASMDKLAGLIMQFPYSFDKKKDRLPYLEKLAKAFSDHTVFIEVRHDSWNNRATMDFFEKNKLHLVNVDLPKMKRHMPLTEIGWGGVGYFRMMGRNSQTWDAGLPKLEGELSDRYQYRYSVEELREVKVKVEGLGKKGSTNFVVFHNDPQANSLYNGFQLRHLVNPKERLKAPASLISAFPSLAGFVELQEEPKGLFG